MNDIQLAETHVSWLIFTPDHVYKIKKPVVFGFVDLSSAEARGRACRAEVELNSVLAPDVYEGVGEFHQPDGAAEPVVVMKRLPADRSLAALVRSASPDLEGHLEVLATILAQFHRRARRGPDVDSACTAEAVAGLWYNNLAELRTVAAGILKPGDIDEAEKLAYRYLRGRQTLLQRRIDDGRAVDGHGDLLCDDTFCLDDGPRILDCLEFSPSLRRGDSLSDIASLAMDLEQRGRPDLSAWFLENYRQKTEDWWPPSLAELYVAYRATVRAKVACIRAGALPAGEPAAEIAQAQRLFASALTHLRAGRVRLVLVGGLPGTGKSTLASHLREMTGWRLLSSDVLRKRMVGLAPEEHRAAAFGYGLYRPEMTAAVYTELLREAEALLGAGESVILDASWLHECWRQAGTEIAARCSAEVSHLLCVTPPEVANQRIQARVEVGSGASDATPAVADAMASLMEPWNEALAIDMSGPLEHALRRTEWALGIVGLV